MRLFSPFYALLIFSAGNLSAAESCSEFAQSHSIQKVVSHLSEIALISPSLWTNYDPTHYSYLLMSVDPSSHCAVLYSEGAIKEARLFTEHVNIDNGFFDCYVKPAKTISAEVDNFLSEFAIDLATVMYVDYDFEFSPEELEIYGGGDLISDILAHEGFHFTAQSSRKIWPKWPNTAGHDEIGPRCYRPSEQILQLFHREASALISAAKFAAQGRNSLSLISTREFLELRTERRNLLSIDEGSREWCEKNEAALEMEEGVAQWIGYGAEIALGHTNSDQFVKYFESELSIDSDSFFYSFGCLQMYLLWKLNPDEFLDTAASLAKSLSWTDGIEAKVKALLH